MLKRQVLRTIQSGKEKEYYSAVTNAALYMAIGGFLNEANELLENLWKYNLEHDRTTWLADRAFEMLWYAANNRPPKVPFSQINIDELEVEQRTYCSGDRYAYKMPDASIDELTGLDAYRQGSILASLRDNKLPETKIELLSLQLLKKSLEDTELKGFPTDIAAPLAAELAARNNEEELAIQIIKLWVSKYRGRWSGYVLSLMAANRHVAPLLLNGTTSNAFGLTKETCKKFIAETITTIDNRIKNGPSLVYGNLSWKELLKKLSELSIKKEPGEYTEEQKEKMWIGNKPADEKDIVAAEERLGLKLPGDYKEFLRVSNGFSNFPLVNPELVKVEKLDYLKNVYLNIHGDTNMFEIIGGYWGENGADTISKYIEDAIAISILPEEQEVWLIQPKLDHKEWQCWFFAYWHPGEYRYRSFRDYMEFELQILDAEFDE